MITKLKHQTRADSDLAISLLQNLVRIPSITGDESTIQSFLRKELENLKLEVDDCESSREQLQNHPAFSDDGISLEGRTSLVARWRGTGGGRSLILNGHVDVVPPGDLNAWNDGPWSGNVHDGLLYGRGSCDMKGGIVTALLAVVILQKMGLQPRGDLLIECVIGEETGGVGTLSTILHGYTADAAVVLEPTRLQLCPIGAGAASFRLRVPGLAAHGSMRMEGVSAIEKFALIHNALLDLENDRHKSFQHPLYKNGGLPAPLSVGKIQAGDWPSSVPDVLIAEGRYGVLPGEGMSEAREQFEERIRRTAEQDPWLSVHPPVVEWFEGQFEPAETPLDSDFLKVLSACHNEITGTQTKMHGVPYGSDLRFFTNYAKIPAVLYGPGNVSQAHSANEFINVEEMFTAAQIVALFIIRWCGV